MNERCISILGSSSCIFSTEFHTVLLLASHGADEMIIHRLQLNFVVAWGVNVCACVEPLASACVHPSRSGVTDTSYNPASYVDQNSGPHTCVASTLPTELSLRALKLNF